MGYVQKKEMRVNENGRPCTHIGKYLVVKESDNMTGIYFFDCGAKTLITSKPKWSQAVKLAKLLNDAYNTGVETEKEGCYWR